MGEREQSSESIPPPRQGPFVSTALICERLLEEKDGTLTAVRIVDRVTLELPAPEPNVLMLVTPLTLSLLAVVRGGSLGQVIEVRLTVRPPKGPAQELTPAGQVVVGGPLNSVNFVGRLNFDPEQDGRYYFDIALDGQPAAQVPLIVTRREASAAKP